MFGKGKSKSSGTSVKKPPPRPPPPSTNIGRSASMGFDPWKEINVKPIVRTQTCSYNITNRSDLIDLSSPSNSPPKSTLSPVFPGVTSNEVADFKYHVGASIFYIKSELKSISGTKPTANPFSPPRPSAQAQALSKTPVKTPIKQPTIIKANTQTSAVAQNNNNYGVTTTKKVLLDWDEPPKARAPQPPIPTVIRPIPPPKKPGLGSLRVGDRPDRSSVPGPPPPFVPPPVTKPLWTEMMMKSKEELIHHQPRYEEPPEESDEDFEDSFDLNTVPEPSGPPPPPPLQQLDDQYSANYVPDGSDCAYGIALYDYVSGEPGDLQFAVGDVIYLTRIVDDSWLFGYCGGSEGMFPSNFINVVVPLEEGQGQAGLDPGLHNADSYYSASLSYPTHYVQALHDFEGSELGDLTLQDGDIVTVVGQVNADWLYGELHGRKGQFPASFIEYVPGNLPLINPEAQ